MRRAAARAGRVPAHRVRAVGAPAPPRAAGGGRVGTTSIPPSGPAGPPPVDPGGDPVEQVLQQLNYYTTVVNTTNQTFEDNDVTNIDDSDTTVDASVNQNITAFGDVTQDFDNDVVSGDGAVAAGDDAQVNTGDGAVQAGDDIEDSNVVTGDVEGSVLADDISDSVIGDDNQVISDSTVGRRHLRRGRRHQRRRPRTPTLGDGVAGRRRQRRHHPQPGEGDLTQIDDSTLERVGRSATAPFSRTTSTSTPRTAPRSPSATGSRPTPSSQDVDIEDNYGTVQVADDATQTAPVAPTTDQRQLQRRVGERQLQTWRDSGNVDASDDDRIDVDNSRQP